MQTSHKTQQRTRRKGLELIEIILKLPFHWESLIENLIQKTGYSLHIHLLSGETYRDLQGRILLISLLNVLFMIEMIQGFMTLLSKPNVKS